MKNIKKIQAWSNGENIELNQINIFIKFDDLKSIAEFGYDLYSNGISYINGEISFRDEEYQNWSGDNDDAYEIIIKKLNLELI